MRSVLKVALVLVVLGTVHSVIGIGAAKAVTQIQNPFGTAPVDIYVGKDFGAQQLVVWQRKSDGACLRFQIGNQNGLFDDYEILGSNGSDMMTTIIFVKEVCQILLGGVVLNGHYVDFYGLGGSDRLEASGDSWLFGMDGNDRLLLNGLGGTLFGGAGDDVLHANGPGGAETLLGEGGNDCLDDASEEAANVDCGSGTDRYGRAPGTSLFTLNCEQFVTRCL